MLVLIETTRTLFLSLVSLLIAASWRSRQATHCGGLEGGEARAEVEVKAVVRASELFERPD
jgi:hypothetical protein